MTSASRAATYDPPRTACILCGSTSLTPDLVDYRAHRIDRCAACGVSFMNPQYTDRHLAEFYAGYINLHPGGEDTARFRMRPDVRQKGKTRALVRLRSLCTGPRILMVGCGDGLEIRLAKACGFAPEGYDVDPSTTAKVALQEGVPVHSGSFHALAGTLAPFDALFLDQVIEHPKDPGAYLATCDALLKKGGVLYLGTPNLASLSNRLKTFADRLSLRSKKGRHFNTKHHLTFFTPAVLRRHLKENLGYEILLVRGSFKPQQNPLVALLGALHANFDSSFLVIAQKPA